MKLISKIANKIIIKDCGKYILVDLGKKVMRLSMPIDKAMVFLEKLGILF